LIGENTVLTTVSQSIRSKVSFPISEQEYLQYARRIQLDGTRASREAALELILADGSVYPSAARRRCEPARST
jgi:hypothetical protein